MLTAEDILFFSLAGGAVLAALLVVFVRNPVYSALFLALCMSVLGAMFFTLQAYFISVAQITVYAGAVMVLFVMVVMLFDLKKEGEEILKFSPVTLAKVLATALLCGFLVGTSWLGISALRENPASQLAPGISAKDLIKPTAAELAAVPKGTQENIIKATEPETQALMKKTIGENPDEDLTAAEDAKLVEKAPGSVSQEQEEFGSSASLSRLLFSKYVFAFEAVSLLLLVAIVGAVALAKSKGGTHDAVR